jgi:hypothetical protein
VSLNRFAKKRDANEPVIVRALRAVGASVEPISAKDAPDLLVGFAGRTYLFEIKTPTGRPSADQLTWHACWKGDPVRLVRSPEEALANLGFLVGPPGFWRRCPRDRCDGSHPECQAVAHHQAGTYPRGSRV